MQQIIRAILGPFASALAGAILGILIAIFLFSIQNKAIINGFALAGALIGAAAELIPTLILLVKRLKALQGKFQNKGKNFSAATEFTKIDIKQIRQIPDKDEARKELLLAEHEARRPICTHCGKNSEPIYQHRKANGQADMRYRDNPLLCNKCFKPYAGVRPWNLPKVEAEQ